MRWLISLLVVANVAFFSWQYYYSAGQEFSSSLTQDVTHEIELLSEARALIPKHVESEPHAALHPVKIESLNNKVDLNKQCLQLGPFDSALSQRWAETILKLNGLPVLKSKSSHDLPVGFWVMIKPFADRVEAFQTLQELRESNIDSYLITHGEFTNGIGLGVFPEHERAEKLQEQLDFLGYETEIVERHDASEDFWLETRYAKPLAQSQPLWLHLSQSFPGLSRQLINCENIENHVAKNENFE